MRRAICFVGLTAIALLQPTYAQLCSSSSNNSTFEWITRVALGSSVNTSGQTNYSDFTQDENGNPTTLLMLEAGQTYNIEIDVTARGGDWDERIRVWFDFNQDNTIEHPQEMVFTTTADIVSNDTITMSGAITLPACAESGLAHMRIILQYDATPTLCGTYPYGETEDYLVVIENDNDNEPTSLNTSTHLPEDSTKPFEVLDFPFSDLDGHTLTAVQIDALPVEGILQLSGISTAVGTLVQVEDIPQLTYMPAPNAYGNHYASFDFSVLDCFNEISESYTFTLHVDSIDDPAVYSPFTDSIPELSPSGTEVGVVEVSDPDDSSFLYSITSGNAENAFSIDNTGKLKVQDSSLLNYTITPVFLLTAKVTSLPSGVDISIGITIQLIDVEHPTTITDTEFFIKEYLPVGHPVAHVIAKDLDYEEFTYTLESNPENALTIDSNTGDIYIQNNSLLNVSENTFLMPSVGVYKASGEQAATGTLLIHILKPTWQGYGTYHSDTSNWNIEAPPMDFFDRILCTDGILVISEEDVNIHSLQTENDARVEVKDGRRLVLKNYFQTSGGLEADENSSIEILERIFTENGDTLAISDGTSLIFQGAKIESDP